MSTDEISPTNENDSRPVTTVDALWNFIRIDINAYTKPEGNQSGTQNQTTSSGAQNQTSPNGADIPKKYLYGQGDDGKMYSTPTMVFSVIGDSDSFVPRPWPTTLFQTALIEAAKSGGETWILFRKNKKVVSNAIQEAYRHYESMEFGIKKNGIKDPQRHIKLINIAGNMIHQPSDNPPENSETCETIYNEINIGETEDQLLKFEKHISKQEVSFFNPKMNIKMPVPIAIIVCEGDLNTIEHIAKALNENIPVIIMKGSGKAADLILDFIDNNDEFCKKASISFGIQFDTHKYNLLLSCLKDIIIHKDRIGVFDLNQDDPLKLSNIVGETVVSCWSMEHVIKTTEKTQDCRMRGL